jgi:hypothetical protein
LKPAQRETKIIAGRQQAKRIAPHVSFGDALVVGGHRRAGDPDGTWSFAAKLQEWHGDDLLTPQIDPFLKG